MESQICERLSATLASKVNVSHECEPILRSSRCRIRQKRFVLGQTLAVMLERRLILRRFSETGMCDELWHELAGSRIARRFSK
jgi:hypothetical protein